MHVLLWPFRFVWRLLTGIFSILGRVATLIVGLILVGLGAALVNGLPILGVPLLVLGVLLLIRAIF